MKKQKVLLVHNYYQIPGGEDTVVANEKRLLEENGHQVILYTRHNSELKELNIWQKLLLPLSTVFNLRTYWEIKKIIRLEHIDVVHVHNTLNLISPSVYYAAVHCGVPVVQTMHNFRMLCPGATFFRNGHICEDCVEHGLECAVKYKCYRGSRVQTLACVISNLIHRWTGIYGEINYICLTGFNKKKLLKVKCVKEENCFIKPNFTFLMLSPNFDYPKKYYLFVGRLEEIKGIELLLEVFSQLEEIELHVAGSGKEAYEGILQKKGINNIHLLGFLNREEIQREYNGAKALIVTSQIYEGFPMSIVEAYANGIPVISGNIGNGGDLVVEGYTGFRFRYNDVDSLKNTVIQFEKEYSGEWGKNAYQRYIQMYSASTNYEILRGIYEKVSGKENT